MQKEDFKPNAAILEFLLGASVNRLLSVAALWTFAVTCSELYLGAYIWQASGKLTLALLLNIAIFGGMVVGVYVGARRDGRRLPLVAASAVLLVLVLGTAALFHHSLIAVPVPIGGLVGLAYGLYFLGYYVAMAALSGEQSDRANARTGLVDAATTLVAPLLGGIVISSGGRVGYTAVFLSAALLLVAAALTARRLPRPQAKAGRGDLAAQPWQQFRWTLVLLGLRDGAMFVWPGLWLFVLSHQAWLLGLYASLTAGSEGLGFWAVEHMSAFGRRRCVELSLLLAGSGALLFVAMGIHPLSLMIFGILQSFAYPFLRVPLEGCGLDLISRHAQGPVLATAQKEWALNAARAASLALLLWVLQELGWHGAQYYLVVLAFIPLAVLAVLLRRPLATACSIR